jgi:hypothetical protein
MKRRQFALASSSRKKIKQITVKRLTDHLMENIEKNKDEKDSLVTDLNADVQFIEFQVITA